MRPDDIIIIDQHITAGKRLRELWLKITASPSLPFGQQMNLDHPVQMILTLLWAQAPSLRKMTKIPTEEAPQNSMAIRDGT